jgi:hypothetical protein
MLDPPARMGYSFDAPTAVGDRRSNRNEQLGAQAPTRQALFSCLSIHYGGLRGAASGLAGVLTGRYCYPHAVRHPFRSKKRGGLQDQLGVPSW